MNGAHHSSDLSINGIIIDSEILAHWYSDTLTVAVETLLSDFEQRRGYERLTRIFITFIEIPK